MNFKVLSILALVALVCVFTASAKPVEEKVHNKMSMKKPAETHAGKHEHHHAAGAAGAAGPAHAHKPTKGDHKVDEHKTEHKKENKMVKEAHAAGHVHKMPKAEGGHAGKGAHHHEKPKHVPVAPVV